MDESLNKQFLPEEHRNRFSEYMAHHSKIGNTYEKYTFEHANNNEIYSTNPLQPTASVNAGDYQLYVGGGSINLEFAKTITGRGSTKYINGFDTLHAAMISLNMKAGPRRPVVQASKNKQTKRMLKSLRLKECYGIARRTEEVSGDRKRRTGFAFLHVFEGRHPHECSQNKTMMYAVNPKGNGCKGPSREREPFCHEKQRTGHRDNNIVSTSV